MFNKMMLIIIYDYKKKSHKYLPTLWKNINKELSKIGQRKHIFEAQEETKIKI